MEICLVYQKEIDTDIVDGVEDAIQQIPTRVTSRIRRMAPWNEDDWEQEKLYDKPQLSRIEKQGNQINADVISRLLEIEYVFPKTCRYVVYVLSNDLFLNDTTFVVGASHKSRPAIVSNYRFSMDRIHTSFIKERIDEFRDLDIQIEMIPIECIKTVAMHEFGHTLGLLPEKETMMLTKGIGGKHCANICVMRPGLLVPDDWIDYTLDRLRFGPFCSRCTSILKLKQV